MKYLNTILTILFSITISIHAQTQNNSHNETTRTKEYNLKSGLAIKGYDPVEYIDNNKAQKGKKLHTHTHKGIKYRFTNQTNLNKFKTSPNKYEPQYGGWCAYAFAKGGGKVSINPKRFKIIDGKLYLFYDTFFGPNTLKLWNQENDTKQLKAADATWKKHYINTL